MTERDAQVVNGLFWQYDSGEWGCTAWDGMVEGRGRTQDEAVEDMLAAHLFVFIRESPEHSTTIVDVPAQLNIVGPTELDPDGPKIVHEYELELPRLATAEEKMIYDAMCRAPIEA